jgi:hypothetical protein
MQADRDAVHICELFSLSWTIGAVSGCDCQEKICWILTHLGVKIKIENNLPGLFLDKFWPSGLCFFYFSYISNLL